MTSLTVDVREVPDRYPELVSRIERGEQVIIQHEGSAARTRLVLDSGGPPTKKRTAGLHAGRGRMADDFDAPLSDDFWNGAP